MASTEPTAGRSRTQGDPKRSGPPLVVRLYEFGTAFLGVSALVGGVELLRDPTGASLGLPGDWLDGTPFTDYSVPGATLLGGFGVGSGVVLAGVMRRRPWAWPAAVALGAGQVVWILVQVALLRRPHVLHPLYGGLGVALVALATRPGFRRYCQRRGE